ncbi:MAG TPA: hypothetical protein DCR58_01390 [Idiomarina baltica]|uniref:Uncharacterized protein n=2 Tax=Alteromonadales TaxID=135622 RepID=A0A358DZG1_9ALTE|nr:hypothetical protein [Alteromonas australica]HAI73711.1 hypothetical protein [Alteromonas australica]HAR55418.1 hypothetical protein [Idiomarina baltica]HBU51313.1 hypothetical protein [Alteromonas australica]|tara:strand:- start:2979 stop:3188 length:210 start_codon:yes stop_codon:yes gene_type:complete
MSQLYEASTNASKAKRRLLNRLAAQVISACQSRDPEDLVPVFAVLSEHNINATELFRAIMADFEASKPK